MTGHVVATSCRRLVACPCPSPAERHCANCGRAIITRPGRHPGNSSTSHVGMTERLHELNDERRKGGA